MFQVTYAVDSLDPNPTIKHFDTETDALDWVNDEVHRRVDHIVQHSQYSVSEKEYEELIEQEFCLAQVE